MQLSSFLGEFVCSLASPLRRGGVYPAYSLLLCGAPHSRQFGRQVAKSTAKEDVARPSPPVRGRQQGTPLMIFVD